MNTHRLPALLLFAALMAPTDRLCAQQYVYDIKLLNLDYESGPLSAWMQVGDIGTGTAPVPFGEFRISGSVSTDSPESAVGVIRDSTGREHSTFTGSDLGNYVVAIPNGRNVTANSKFHTLGMFNLTSIARKMTLAELNGPTFTASVGAFSSAPYPKQWRPNLLAGFTPGDGTWWVVYRVNTHTAFDLLLHTIADTLVVGVEGDVFGKLGTKVDPSMDSSKIRLVNTSRLHDVSLEVVDWRTDTISPFVASAGQVVPFGDRQVIVRRGSDVLIDTVLTIRPYGYYDLVVLQADSERPDLRVDERLVDRVAARIFPAAAQSDGTTPYWKIDARTIKQEAGIHAKTRVVFLDSTLGEINRDFITRLRYLEVHDEFQSRIARYRLPSPSPFQKTYLITEADGETVLYWYDEFASGDQSLSEIDAIPLSTLSLTAGFWNFATRLDSMILSLPLLQIHDTVASMTSRLLGKEFVPVGTDFAVMSGTGEWESTGLLDGPGGGNTFLLADDEPTGGIRTVVLGTPHGRAPGELRLVNFTEGIGSLYLYRSSFGTDGIADSIPEGELRVLEITTSFKDTIVVVTPSGDTLGIYRKDARDWSSNFVYDGNHADGVVWRYDINDRTFGVLNGTRFELAGTGAVSGPGTRASFSLRPVPGADWVTVDFSGLKREAEYVLTVVDVLGSVVLERTILPGSSLGKSVGVDCSSLPVGTYYFLLSDQEGSLGAALVPIVRQ